MGRTFPSFRFEGSHLEVGQQYGEACRDLIHQHRDLALARLEDTLSISADEALARTLWDRPWVQKYAPFFDDEITGMAEGSGITLAEAWLLQLRAEVGVVTQRGLEAEPGDECTSFAVQPEAASDGIGMVGQNADLPPFYREVGIVAEMVFDDMPSILMLLPAGQVSYLGINDRGLGVGANFLTCDGWRTGFPRYFFSRLALTHDTVDDAIAAIEGLHRASSRNLIMLDGQGTAADLETTPASTARIEPRDGVLAHANHFSAPDLFVEERAKLENLVNSRQREETMWSLLERHRDDLNPQTMQAILRDRSGEPDCLCRYASDHPDWDTMTFASLIAQPTEGRMWLAVGPPSENEYVEYAFQNVIAPEPIA
jgi:isopenicillin-N N-acyltransferase-like protein